MQNAEQTESGILRNQNLSWLWKSRDCGKHTQKSIASEREKTDIWTTRKNMVEIHIFMPVRSCWKASFSFHSAFFSFSQLTSLITLESLMKNNIAQLGSLSLLKDKHITENWIKNIERFLSHWTNLSGY